MLGVLTFRVLASVPPTPGAPAYFVSPGNSGRECRLESGFWGSVRALWEAMAGRNAETWHAWWEKMTGQSGDVQHGRGQGRECLCAAVHILSFYFGLLKMSLSPKAPILAVGPDPSSWEGGTLPSAGTVHLSTAQHAFPSSLLVTWKLSPSSHWSILLQCGVYLSCVGPYMTWIDELIIQKMLV